MVELDVPDPVDGATSTATTTPMTDTAAHTTFTAVSRSEKYLTETGRATTGASAAMIRAVAIVTDWIAMKKTQMFSPKSTPATPARRKSALVGQRLVRVTITSSTPDAIHIRQNDKTTPDACVDLPSTPPVDHNRAAKIIASTPERPANFLVTLRLADLVDRVIALPVDERREVAEVVTCAR
jgi:hypothetical protein